MKHRCKSVRIEQQFFDLPHIIAVDFIVVRTRLLIWYQSILGKSGDPGK